MLATSDMDSGASRQIAQVKSGGGLAAAAATATAYSAFTGTQCCAAGLRFVSSPSSSKTMGVSFEPRAADPRDRAARGGPLLGDVVVVLAAVVVDPRLPPATAASLAADVTEAVEFTLALLLLLLFKRVERRSGTSMVEMVVAARMAALRVDLLGGAAVVLSSPVVPTEKEGTVDSIVPMSRWRKDWLMMIVLFGEIQMSSKLFKNCD